MLVPEVPLPAAVLWDMDGTLIDTEPLWFAAEAALAARHGVAWGPELSEGLVGMPLDVYGATLVEHGVDLTVDQVVAELVAEVRGGLVDGVTWQPGVRDLLTGLAAAGVPCALVTMSYRELAEPVVAQAPPGAFRVVVAGQDVEQGKPHPEPYQRAAAALGVPIGRCVAIEDSPPGITSAMAAGARTLGVPHIVDVTPRPGLSRVPSLAEVDLAMLAAIGAGQVLDLLEPA
ncbi:HAD family hydrolase [Actinotalea sp. M2MS4P-6]|uniref:HAD family hydrolase n=1 Tax=Actinotalea sp. M2MS4P-6 TaxID=2983762 RepID=UPI0021E3AB88|nr:HAD family hydrolase [Actinotalea sp. M2MS4P-6]MCV2394812.1 HAD family hydrolase [Actinotalea sp. M2MS4P-6]